MSLGENAKEFLKKESTVDEKGVRHLTQKKYMEFMSSMGATKEVLETVNNATSELINGMYSINTDSVLDQIKKGEDPLKVKATTVVTVPNGSMRITNTGASIHPIPGQPGKQSVSVNKGTVKIIQDRTLDKEMVQNARNSVVDAMTAEMKKQLGL